MFFKYLFKTKPFIQKLNKDLTGIRDGKIISYNHFSNIYLPVPTIPEQQKIADCLSSLDELIEAHEQKLDTLKQHKKGLMQRLFPAEGETMPRWRFPEFRNAGEWEEDEIGNIFNVTRGQVLAMTEVQTKQTETYIYPVYSSQTKNNGLAGFYSKYLYEDAITWTTDGANAGEVNFRKGKFYCTNVCGVLLNNNGYANKCISELINSVSKKYVSYVGNPKLMNNVMEKIKIPIKIKNDSKAAAEAEYTYGALQGYNDSVFLCLGTGIGSAVFLNGKLLKANKHIGFELGHMVIDKNGIECNCGKRGCFETYC